MNRKEKLEQLLDRQPNDAFLHYALAMELVKENQTDAALERFERVLSIDPAYLAAYFQKANTLIAAGRPDEAKSALQSGIKIARSKGESHAEDEMQNLLNSLD